MKKCPICNSTRIKTNAEEGYMSCDRCGYVNKKNKKSERNIKRKWK